MLLPESAGFRIDVEADVGTTGGVASAVAVFDGSDVEVSFMVGYREFEDGELVLLLENRRPRRAGVSIHRLGAVMDNKESSALAASRRMKKLKLTGRRSMICIFKIRNVVQNVNDDQLRIFAV